MTQKNAFGFDVHPTDDWLHWQDYSRPEYVAKVRAAYDTLVAVDPEALKIIMKLAQDHGETVENERHVGEDL